MIRVALGLALIVGGIAAIANGDKLTTWIGTHSGESENE